jgi:hypothetical protein
LMDHAFLLVPSQKVVGDFLATFRDYPPRQKAASFTIDEVLAKLQEGGTGLTGPGARPRDGLPRRSSTISWRAI